MSSRIKRVEDLKFLINNITLEQVSSVVTYYINYDEETETHKFHEFVIQ